MVTGGSIVGRLSLDRNHRPALVLLLLVAGDLARLSHQSVVDDNRDDNRDDSYSLNADIYRPNSLLSCVVSPFAGAWQCGV